jgi:DNA topoisomerase-1
MSRILIIVESPNKAKKFNEMFEGRFVAMPSYGHICDLPRSPTVGIGIDRAAMKGQYELTVDSKRRVDGARVILGLKNYLKNNPGTEVYIGSDDDREGESIGAFVSSYLGLKNPKRMLFNAITKEKILDAFDNAGEINWNAVSSREARRLLDRVIGYVASPLLFSIVKQKGAAAGRVQTAVEALVIERERKIRNHKIQSYYSVHFDMGGWQAEWKVPAAPVTISGPKPNSEFDIDDNTARCFDMDLASLVASQKALAVSSCTTSTEKKYPPSPLYTSSMLQIADRILGWDAEKTMQVAQKLFEGDGSGHGHITYHRTDSPNIDEQAAEEIRSWLRDKGLPVPATPNKWESKNKQAQEGHEAIRPSYLDVEEAGADNDQRALYKLIRDRAIYSQLAPAIYEAKNIILNDLGQGTHQFTARARVLLDAGWLKTSISESIIMQDQDSEEIVPTVVLPDLKRGAIMEIKKSEIQTHQTKTPPRYTMRSLTAKLEKLSIGRPATLATLLKNVQTKGTILVRKDKKLEATKFAETCYDILYPRFTFSHIGYTAELELALDQIANGLLDGPSLVRAVWDRLDIDCATAVNESRKSA